MNKRGEAITLAVATVAGVCLLVGLLFRPIMDKVLPMFGNNQKIVSTKVVESKPVWIKNPDNTYTMVQTTSTSIDNSAEPVKLTFMQKVMNLGNIGMILVALGFIFPPFGVILTLIWKKVTGAAKAALTTAHEQIDQWNEKHDLLHSQAADIVQAVDAGLKGYDATVASYALLASNEIDPIKKANIQAIILALTTAKSTLMTTISTKMDSDSKVLVGQLKQNV